MQFQPPELKHASAYAGLNHTRAVSMQRYLQPFKTYESCKHVKQYFNTYTV
jgi:hypothetical protein